MRRNFILTLAFIATAICTQANAASLTIKTDTTARTTVFTIVEQMPKFPGGESEMMNYLSKHIVYPSKAKNNNIQGRVYVNFVIDTNGDVRDAKIVRGIGGGCDEEALRIIKAMPIWAPGKQNGKIVDVYYNLPIKFTLNNPAPTK